MDDDQIERPICKVLYRQSSIETRLSPVHLSEEDTSDESGEENDTGPKIVDCVRKPTEQQKTEATGNENEKSCKNVSNSKDKFKEKLNDALLRPKMNVSSNWKKEGAPGVLKVTAKQNPELAHEENAINNKNDSNSKDDIRELLSTVLLRPKGNISSSSNKVFSAGVLKAVCVPKRQEKEEEETSVGASEASFKKAKETMATIRPKSPRPVPIKAEKDESIWDKIGTLGRKKRIKEVQEVQAEGKYAIDSPGCATVLNLPPEDYNLDDNEERSMIDPRAYDDLKFIDLLNVLKEWINDELASQRIIVQDIAEDLYDGQVLQKLLEKLTGDKLDVPEVTQSEEGQKQKLMVVLDHFNQILGIHRRDNKWTVEAIHSKNIVSITHLLVALARHFRPPVRLPEHVSVDVVIVQKVNNQLVHKTIKEYLTKTYDDVGMRCERDAFDTLFDHAPDKLQLVKKSLVTFVNKHLNKMNFEVTEIETQFHDGVYLIMLMGLLEGFFVPHYSFHLTPHEFEQKVHNVSFAFDLMEEVGLQKPKARPEDVVNMDLKSTLRVLYVLFLKYKTVL